MVIVWFVASIGDPSRIWRLRRIVGRRRSALSRMDFSIRAPGPVPMLPLLPVLHHLALFLRRRRLPLELRLMAAIACELAGWAWDACRASSAAPTR